MEFIPLTDLNCQAIIRSFFRKLGTAKIPCYKVSQTAVRRLEESNRQRLTRNEAEETIHADN